jgi:hypothetical protein
MNAGERIAEDSRTRIVARGWFRFKKPISSHVPRVSGSIAGACAPILKAAFNGSISFQTLANGAIQVTSEDGLSLAPYFGTDSEQITTNGEINKLASNIGLGRNFAGVHWRTDYSNGLQLGEAVALSILADQREVYGEEFSGFQISKFDRTNVTV